jgi:hypothetical protein
MTMRSIRKCGAPATTPATAPGRVMLLPPNLPGQQIGWPGRPARLAISTAVFSFPSRS